MGPDEKNLRKQLLGSGLAASLIDAAWPHWWSEAAEASPSARNELRFILARALGLDPRALIDGDQVRFAATVGPRFKALKAEDAPQRHAIVSFGQSVARMLNAALPDRSPPQISAMRIREFLLENGVVPDFQSITALCWQIGIPVVYLELLPFSTKRMHAMAAGQGGRSAILVAIKDSLYAKAAFTIAHELGHIMLGHLEGESAYVDIDDPMALGELPDEEQAANEFALELLTGRRQPIITTSIDDYSAAQLAQAAQKTGTTERIDPSTIALCDGFRTGDWKRSTIACLRIQGRAANIATEANEHAEELLDMDEVGEDGEVYLRRVLGLADV